MSGNWLIKDGKQSQRGIGIHFTLYTLDSNFLRPTL